MTGSIALVVSVSIMIGFWLGVRAATAHRDKKDPDRLAKDLAKLLAALSKIEPKKKERGGKRGS